MTLSREDQIFDLYTRWEESLNHESPSQEEVFKIEAEASELGVDLWQINNVLLNGLSGSVRYGMGDWNPELHPRGLDGRFIEILGDVALFKFFDKKGVFHDEDRGKVVNISKARDWKVSRPNSVDVEVELEDGSRVKVKPYNLKSIDVKGELVGDYFGVPEPEPVPIKERVDAFVSRLAEVMYGMDETALDRLFTRFMQTAWPKEVRPKRKPPVTIRRVYPIPASAVGDEMVEVVLAALLAADWNPDLHPRGRDGRFIEILGLIRLFDFNDSKGNRISESNGTVRAIRPSDQRGNPDIEVELPDGDVVTVKPNQVESGMEAKARLTEDIARTPDLDALDDDQIEDAYFGGDLSPEDKAAFRSELERRGLVTGIDLDEVEAPEPDESEDLGEAPEGQLFDVDVVAPRDVHEFAATPGFSMEEFQDGTIHIPTLNGFELKAGQGEEFSESIMKERAFEIEGVDGKVLNVEFNQRGWSNDWVEFTVTGPDGEIESEYVMGPMEYGGFIHSLSGGSGESKSLIQYRGDIAAELDRLDREDDELILMARDPDTHDEAMEEIAGSNDFDAASVRDEFLARDPVGVRGAEEEGPSPRTNQIGEPATIAEGDPGSRTNPVRTDDALVAVQALREGKFVELESVDQVSTLLDELARIANEAKAAGTDAGDYDLCQVSVPGTNLFCAESKGIERINMPQLLGVPAPGSRGSELPANSDGEVDLADEFVNHLRAQGVDVTEGRKAASYLKASQSQLVGAKVAGMMKAVESGNEKAIRNIRETPIFVTKDGYVVDGHHRWAAVVGMDLADNELGDFDMPIREIDMDILDVLEQANKFAGDWGLPQVGGGPGAEVGPMAANPPNLPEPENVEREDFVRRTLEGV